MYNTTSGLISSTVNAVPANADQLKALETAGYGFAEVPDGVNGSNAIIDVVTKQAIQFAAPPAPVPNVLVQLVAAWIKAGSLSADDFHPVTIVEMNSILGDANMAKVAAPTALGAKNSVG